MTARPQARPRVDRTDFGFRAPDRGLILAKPIPHQIGGYLALALCNMAREHLAEPPDEMLCDWESFIRWAAQVGLIPPESYLELLRHPGRVDSIVQLREAIYRIGLAVAGKQRVPQPDFASIRKPANGARPNAILRGNNVDWRPDPSQSLAQLHSLLASEALSLFFSPKALRIGICEGGVCDWLFRDEDRGKPEALV